MLLLTLLKNGIDTCVPSFFFGLYRSRPGDGHVDGFAGNVIGVECRRVRAIWGNRKTEPIDHFFSALFALLLIAMVPLNVNARHQGRFAGFGLVQPYQPAPVKQVRSFVASLRVFHVNGSPGVLQSFDERLNVGLERLSQIVD